MKCDRCGKYSHIRFCDRDGNNCEDCHDKYMKKEYKS